MDARNATLVPLDETRQIPRLDQKLAGTVARVRPGTMNEELKTRIYRLWRQGIGPAIIADRFGLTRTAVTRVVNEVRARRLFETKLDFIPNPSFDDPGARAEILGSTPEAAIGQVRRTAVPADLPPYLAELYEVPLLTREQEAHLFRKMNYLKHQASRRRDQVDPTRAKVADLNEIERLLEEALAVKNLIIRANLRLVVSIAKKHIGPTNNFFELVSDGNMSLIRAVEKFDYARGNKFSTYATWAIMRNFARAIPEEEVRRERFRTGHEELFDGAADGRSDEGQIEAAHKQSHEVVQGMLGRLNERERHIIVGRYGLGGADEQTLEALGRELGVTKERIRQIEARAHEKLRKLAVEEKLDLETA